MLPEKKFISHRSLILPLIPNVKVLALTLNESDRAKINVEMMKL